MRIPLRKIKVTASYFTILASLVAYPSLSQAAPPAQSNPTPTAPPAQAPAAQSAPAQVRNGGASDGLGDATNTGFDYLFNHKAQEGSAAQQIFQANEVAKSRALAHDAAGDRMTDSQMQQRFLKYLGLPEVSDDVIKAYAADTDSTFSLLHDNKVVDAYKQLYKLASYESLDAGYSWDLASRISSIWDAGKFTEVLSKQNEALQNQINANNNNADMMADQIRRDQLEYQKKLKDSGITPRNQPSNQNNNNQNNNNGNNGNNSSTASNPLQSMPTAPMDGTSFLGKMEFSEEFTNSITNRIKMHMNELKAEKLLDKTKQDFADYIASLNNTKYYREVLLAANFYRALFNEGDYPVSVEKQVNIALDVNRDVLDSVEVFKQKVGTNEIAAATDRLEEAFMLDEHHPALLAIPLEMKQKVERFTKDISKMENMIEARDYGDLDPLLTEMKQLAPDFDATKANSLVAGVKLESQMHLGQAQMAAQAGDLKTAMDEFKSAAAAWPNNPDLKTLSDKFFHAQDQVTQALADFDRLVKEENYREIFDKQLMFAPAMKDDTARQAQLKDALLKVTNAEMALQKSNAMQLAGNIDGAWETVELAVKDLPNDLKLNSMRAELSGKAAEFVSAINKAKDAEDKSELGSSLTWYAIAQRQYPASTLANDAIERISKQILEKSSI